MIGQVDLLNTFRTKAVDDVFPKFSIIVGLSGSGKKTICSNIAKMLSATLYIADITVDEVRAVISVAYKSSGNPAVFVFPDADTMSPAAKSALLKVTEEPPKNVYFILTLTDLNNTLSTLKSRAQIFYMNPYTRQELLEFYHSAVQTKSQDDEDIICELCETPGEVLKLCEMKPVQFVQYVNKVVDNISITSGSNAFKIANKIKLKETDTDKYDLRLFWKAFMYICTQGLKYDVIKFAPVIQVTSKYLQNLRNTSLNKQMLFDTWLLDIRKLWL